MRHLLKTGFSFLLIAMIHLPSWAQSPEVAELRRLLQSQQHDTQTVQTYRDLWSIYMSHDLDSAYLTAQQGLDFSTSIRYPNGITDFNVYLAFIEAQRGQNEQAISRLKNALTLINEQFDYINGEVFILQWLSTFYKDLNKVDSAMAYLQLGLERVEGLHPYFSIAAHTGLGGIYQQQYLYKSAIHHFQQADSLCQLNPEQNQTNTCTSARANLGVILLEINDFESAEKYLLEAISEFKARQEDFLTYDAQISLARLLHLRGNDGQALDLINKSADFYSQQESDIMLTRALKVKLSILLTEKARKQAQAVAEQYIQLSTKLNDSLRIAQGTVELSSILLTDDIGQAETLLQGIHRFVDSSGDDFLKKQYAKTRMDLHRKMGDLAGALDWGDRHFDITVRIRDSLDARQLKEMEIAYDIRNKEQHIALLNTENKLARTRQTQQIYLGIAVGSIFILLIASLLYLYRIKQRRNAQLMEAQQLRTKLFSDISHEFRTPLTLIKGPLDLLTLKLAEQNEVAGELSIVQRNASKLNRLVDSIQNLARLDAGQLKLHIRPTLLSKHLKIIAASFESMALSKGLQFDTKINLSKQEYYYDPVHLETIIYNLLSNALKFTSEGCITMTAEVREEDLEISVADTGVGLSQSQQAQVFDRYYRTENDEASVEGIGIGLALSSELAKLHHGSIEVRSALGKGSTFILRLPIHGAYYEKKGLSIGDQFLLSKPTKLASSKTLDNKAVHSFHEDEFVILLVEDNPDMQRHLKAIFEDEFQILLAKNGKEGSELALHHIPDIIISDLMMPVMDGQAFLKEVKTDAKTSHIPFIMLTANHLEEEKIKGLKQRVDDYMTKPFSVEEIRLKVNNLIALREQLRQKYQQAQEATVTEIKSISETEEKFWNQLNQVVQENFNNTNFSVEDFAKAMFMSRMQLHRKLKALTNLSTSIFLRTERLKIAKKMLAQPDAIVANIAYDVGFSSPSFFSKCFKEQFGMTPKEMQIKLQN